MVSRLETLALMAGTELPSRAIREQIASALDLVVHQARLRDGSRKITHVTEVQGLEGDAILLQDLFVFRQRGLSPDERVLGCHEATGCRPRFLEKLEAEGVSVPLAALNDLSEDE